MDWWVTQSLWTCHSGHFFQDSINVHKRQRVSHDAVLTLAFNINDGSNVRLKVLTPALLKIQVFWNIMPCCCKQSFRSAWPWTRWPCDPSKHSRDLPIDMTYYSRRPESAIWLIFSWSLTDMYVLFCTFCFHRANWHSSATLTEVFPWFFLSCKANARV